MTGHWKPGDFKDTYHDDLMARIKEKIKLGQTKEITEPGKDEDKPPRSAQVIDLADLLMKSLGRGGVRGKATARRTAPTRGKPALHVVPSPRAATRTTAKRKRA